MPSHLPVALVVTDAQKTAVETIISAYRYPDSVQFGRPLLTADTVNPTWQSTPTHWVMFDASTTGEDASVYQDFANGVLPPLNSGAIWGEDGFISYNDALIAVNGANLQTASVSGDVNAQDFMIGKADGDGQRPAGGGFLGSLGLMYRPDPDV